MSMLVNSARYVVAGGGGSTSEAYAVPGIPSPVYVIETDTSDQQYLVPGNAYVNEQGT